MVGETPVENLTGVRLEVIADKRLPSGGPGRAGNGNFVLSEIELTAAPNSNLKHWDLVQSWNFEDPQVAAVGRESDIAAGLTGLAQLNDGQVYFCVARGSALAAAGTGATSVEFAGPHPAGLAGTHIHFLDPVGSEKTVWHLNYQDLIACGRLFSTGQLDVERVVQQADRDKRALAEHVILHTADTVSYTHLTLPTILLV